ncbi:SAM50-like protein CG7639 [Teleopsis dalmanni]|uniref:SAM50-like protein CG7639 n=1 Tax=Teleopsis dalmanni TaxID=139649 RepID=UPI0018CF21D7|nr:SAM50-like protein CG7639 [Teleopsis dalmanni]XP_037951806.1 SAM50-like protein CG7639 [Teleopsis dalmanni]XP_037951807.1 SAM50-like protein CG7639 [Teleopsis dalmanni]
MAVKPNRAANEKKYDLEKIPARVDRVKVSGLLRTHNDYVMKAAEGLFSAKNFQDVMLESMNAKSYLHELGIFKDIYVRVDISRGENPSPNGYEVTFTGNELSRVVGTFGTEVGQNEGTLRSELTFPNIFGRGESVSLQGSYSSTRANDVTLKFWKSFFHTKFIKNRPEISFSIFRRLDRMDVSSFQTSNLGCIADLSLHTWFPFKLTHSFQYESSIRDLSLLNKMAPFKIREHCGPKLASLLRYSVIFDERDNHVFPTEGVLIRSVNEYSGLGGNIAYMSNSTHAEVSFPIIGSLVGQLCGRVGIIKETKNTTTLPINNLFYCGGPLTLRGFKYGGAGPVEEGTPIGAQTYWSAGLHLWAPLPFNRVFKGLGDNFRTHLFCNVGNFNSFSLERMRVASGLGLAFKLGDRARIELNYCIPLRKYANDRVEKNNFQFGIGYEFV